MDDGSARDDATTTSEHPTVPAGTPVPEAEPSGPCAALVVLSGWEVGRVLDIDRHEVVIGRSPRATLQVPSPAISRQHARLVCQEGEEPRFRIVDLDSANGVFVNGKAVRQAEIGDRDTVQLGDVVFKLVVNDPVEREFYRELHRRLHFDALTGLLTMDSFVDRLRLEIGRAPEVFCLAMTDMDGLKAVNDTFGHLAGRMVVREMGSMIRSVLRSSDRAGLYGGDEAVLLLAGTPIAEAEAVCERLRIAVERRSFETDGGRFRLTISQGLAEWPTHGATAEELIASADRALYAAKEAGRNCVARCKPAPEAAG